MLIIEIHNDGTGTDEDSNYEYRVLVNRKVIEKGNVSGHNRKLGWENLVYQLLQQKRFLHKHKEM